MTSSNAHPPGGEEVTDDPDDQDALDALEASARRIMDRARSIQSHLARVNGTPLSVTRELAIMMAMLEARAPASTRVTDAERIAAMLDSVEFYQRVCGGSVREAITIAVMTIRSGEW